jgi:uncharacterized CHY-type Zn-finger protein
VFFFIFSKISITSDSFVSKSCMPSTNVFLSFSFALLHCRRNDIGSIYNSKPKLYISSVREYSLMICGCRCIKCKHQQLESFSFVAADGFDEMHHTCLMCGTHFNHLDGETYSNCQACNYPHASSSSYVK